MVEHDLKHKFQRKKKNQKKTINLTNINTEEEEEGGEVVGWRRRHLVRVL